MTKLQIFDPPMCCSSGVCGTNVDTKLVKFLNDTEWLKKQGIEIKRYNLSSAPDIFVSNEVVKNTLQKEGNECLPLILVNGQVVFKGNYPERKSLAKACGIEWKSEYTSDKAVPIAGATTEICGADCDCHKSAISNSAKKFIFAAVIIVIAAILAFKAFYKASAAELNTNTNNAIHSVTNKKAALGKTINSLGELNFSGQDAAFVYIPTKNEGISNETKSAALKAKKALATKKVKVGLYTLSLSSPDYTSASAKAAPPSILVVYKNGGKGAATGSISETSVLQAYVAATRDCGSNCPCHK